MTGPSAFDIFNQKSNTPNVQNPTPSPQNGGGSAFDILPKDQQSVQKEPGFLDKVKTIFNNFIPEVSEDQANSDIESRKKSGSLFYYKPGADPLIDKLVAANKDGQLLQATKLAGSDIYHMGDTDKIAKFFDIDHLNDMESRALTAGKNTLVNMFDPKSGVTSSIPSSLLGMITTPIKAVTGLDIDEPDLPIETVQARAQNIKDSAAQVVAALVTEGTSSALNAESLAGKTLSPFEMGIKEKAGDLSTVMGVSLSKVGNLAKTATRGGLAASLGGVSYGAVSGANDPNQIEKIVGSSIMFATLGAVIGALLKGGSDIKNVKNNVELANQVSSFRKLQFDLNNSIKDLDTKATSLVTSDDLADAVIKNKVLNADITPTIVQGVTKAKLATLPDQLPYDVHTFGDGDKVDALLMPKALSDIDVTPFKTSGFMNGETVSVNGKEYNLDSTIPSKDGTTALVSDSKGQQAVPIESLRRTDNGILFDPENVLDRQYNAIKSALTKGSNLIDVPVAELTDKFKTLSYNKQLYFSNRLAQDVLLNKQLDIGSMAEEFGKDNLASFYAGVSRPIKLSPGSIEDFIDQANTNGYKVEVGDAGKIVLKDMSDGQGRIVGEGKNISEALDFMNKSNQAKGESLFKGLQEPVGNGVGFKFTGDAPNVNRPEPIPFLQSPLGWLGNKVDRFDQAWKMANAKSNVIIDWFTGKDNIFKSIDQIYGTRFHSQFYDPLDQAKNKSLAEAGPYIKNNLINIAKMSTGLDLKDLQKIGFALESMSPKTVVSNGFSRPLTDIEQKFSSQFDNNETIQKAFKLRAFLRNNINPSPEDLAAFKKGVGIDSESERMNSLMTQIEGFSKDNANLNYIIRHARSVNDNGVDRAQFYKDNNMTPQHIAIVNALDNLYKDTATKFGINPKDMINGYMPHARLYQAGDLQGTLDLFNRQGEPDATPFFSAQSRTGELDSYETNPLVAAYRHITAGFDALHYNPAAATAKAYLEKVMSKGDAVGGIIPDVEKIKIRAIAEGYLNDKRGRTPAMSSATGAMIEGFLKEYVPNLHSSTRDVILGLTKSVQVGTQGFKIGAGTRDFLGAGGNIIARFGLERFQNIVRLGAQEVANGNKLIEQGHISGLTLDRLVNPTEDANSVPNYVVTGAKSAYQRFGELSLKGSGQEQVYNMYRQGAYMDTFQRVAGAARDLRSGKIDQEGFLKQINADKDFNPSIAAEIRNQLNQSPVRLDELAKYLGRESTRQTTPSYGLGNNPSGWNRNIGKLLGQYGVYSQWLLHGIQEAATTGTIGDRLGRAARFAGWTASVAAMNNATGMNFSPWYIHRIGFSGGPLGQLGMNMYNAVGSTGYEQNYATDQLSRLLPIQNGEFHKQFYIPGSFAFSDYADALDGNPLSAVGIHPQGTSKDMISSLVNKVTNP